jgi:hypothetical protein
METKKGIDTLSNNDLRFKSYINADRNGNNIVGNVHSIP